MPIQTTRPVQGLRELGERFKLLGSEVQDKLARRATAAAATVIKKRAKALAPVASEPYTSNGVTTQPGNLARQTITKRIPKGKTDLTSEHIVTLRSKKKDGYAYRVGVMQEFGTVNHPPKPFMRPALDGGVQQAEAAMVKVLARGIERAAKGERS